ncbi:MAG: hydrogenase small subunit [Coriobacteriia bacterium]
MAITRRQFVTRLGALAAAMGISQSQLAQMTEAFAYEPWDSLGTSKPKVIWVHGAECTGCSTSILGLFEDAREDTEAGVTALAALMAVVGETNATNFLANYRTRVNSIGNYEDNAYVVDIADVLLDFIDLQYHETIMGMGGDLAATYLKDQMAYADSGNPFVLVVEGAVQPKEATGYWDSTYTTGNAPWCSIGVTESFTTSDVELSFDDVVYDLANSANCKAIVAVGQCATFGGYPAAVSPILREGMTGAMGVYEFLTYKESDAASKVINVPGCPTNPWWFALTVIAWLVDACTILRGGNPVLGVLNSDLSINTAAVDRDRRLTAVYGYPVHGPYCPRFPKHATYQYAEEPGQAGCMFELGCKGPFTSSMCGVHGWNGQQPKLLFDGNPYSSDEFGVATQCKTVGNGRVGGFCVAAGSTCKGCTERGYPDSFVPFVALD